MDTTYSSPSSSCPKDTNEDRCPAQHPPRLELGARLGLAGIDGPDGARAVVAEQVRPVERGRLGAAVDVATGDRAALLARGCTRSPASSAPWSQPAERVAARTLHDRPAEVQAALAGLALDVDLLDLVLADVADPEVPGLRVEARPPRVAQAVVPELLAGPPPFRNGLSFGMAYGPSLVHVDAQDAAEQVVCVLAVAERVARRVAAAVTRRDVQVAVGAEAQPAAVVVPLGSAEVEDGPGRTRRSPPGPARRCRYSTTRVSPDGRVVVDVEPPVLARTSDGTRPRAGRARRPCPPGRAGRRSVPVTLPFRLQDPDEAGPLDEVQPPLAGAVPGEVDGLRVRADVDELLELELDLARLGTPRAWVTRCAGAWRPASRVPRSGPRSRAPGSARRWQAPGGRRLGGRRLGGRRLGRTTWVGDDDPSASLSPLGRRDRGRLPHERAAAREQSRSRTRSPAAGASRAWSLRSPLHRRPGGTPGRPSRSIAYSSPDSSCPNDDSGPLEGTHHLGRRQRRSRPRRRGERPTACRVQ